MGNRICRVALVSVLAFFPAAPCAFAGGEGSSPGKRQGMREIERRGTEAAETQLDLFRVSAQALRRARLTAYEIGEAAKRPVFTLRVGREMATRLKSEIRAMNQAHYRLLQSLNQEQRKEMDNRLNEINRLRYRVNARMDRMEEEIVKDNPDRNRMARYAREMEEAMLKWQEEYDGMAPDLEVR